MSRDYCMTSLSIFNLIFGLLLAVIFYRIYFDRKLKNHTYLFWYGTWFGVRALQILIFEYLYFHELLLFFPIGVIDLFLTFPIGMVYFLLSFVQSILLLLAALSFSRKKFPSFMLYVLIFSFILYATSLCTNNLILLAMAKSVSVAIMVFNLISLSKARYKVLRIPLILSWFGWIVLEYKLIIPGDAQILIVLANINIALTSLTVLGVHLHKILLERDCYKIKARNLQKSLDKIDKLEINLDQMISLLSE